MGSSCSYKNSRAWRRDGFKTIFNRGRVYLVRPDDGMVWSHEVSSGRWMDVTDLDDWQSLGPVSSLPADVRQQVEVCLEHCYCDQGVGLCDFCAGIRIPKRRAA